MSTGYGSGSRDIRERFSFFLLAAVSVLFVTVLYFANMFYSAKTLGNDVYVSWYDLRMSMEKKAEAASLLSGYVVRSTGAGNDVFRRMFDSWEALLASGTPEDIMNAGKRAVNESYGVIAMAKSASAVLDNRAVRILEGIDEVEMGLIEDMQKYNESVARLREKAGEFHFSDLFLALSGCGDFGLMRTGREADD